MQADPEITICMAAFNSSQFISEAIESVRCQTFNNWELICVDDGSEDNTAHIIEEFAKRDPRIHLIRQENTGAPLARRTAYLAGKGKFFINLDSDDWFADNSLDILIKDAHTSGCDMVMADMKRYNSELKAFQSFSTERGMCVGQVISGKKAFELTFPWVVHGSFLSKREIIMGNISMNNYFNNFNSDEYLTRKYCLSARSIFFSAGAYYYRLNPNSITGRPNPRWINRLQTDYKLLELCLNANASPQVLNFTVERVANSVAGFGWHLGHNIALGLVPWSQVFWGRQQVVYAADACISARRQSLAKKMKVSYFTQTKFFCAALFGFVKGYLRAFNNVNTFVRAFKR